MSPPESPTKHRPTVGWRSPWPFDAPPDAVEAPTVRTPTLPPAGEPPLEFTRRDLFLSTAIGWGAFIAAGGVASLATARLLFPNVSFEPPMVFKTHAPSSFAPNTVDTTWKESNAVWIVNTAGHLIALSTVCTHLGCTPNWLPAQNKFKCPCHGSGYYISGINFEGPTPRPLERAQIWMSTDDGQIVVDKAVRYLYERGQWTDPMAFIKTA
jgi:cytochrome b6-f complex iron-sulfur subunit